MSINIRRYMYAGTARNIKHHQEATQLKKSNNRFFGIFTLLLCCSVPLFIPSACAYEATARRHVTLFCSTSLQNIRAWRGFAVKKDNIILPTRKSTLASKVSKEDNLREYGCRNLIFLGSGIWASQGLQKLIDASKLDHSFQVVAAITKDPKKQLNRRRRMLDEKSVMGVASDNDIPVLLNEDSMDRGLISYISNTLNPDVCLSASYGGILSNDFLQLPRFGTYNIHPSMLPKYRGPAPIQRCLLNGEESAGVTILKCVAAVDAGPVVYQEAYKICDEDDAQILTKLLLDKGIDAFIRLLPQIWNGSVVKNIRRQNNTLATFAKKVKKEESHISFSGETAQSICQKLKAFTPWPGVRCKVKLNIPPGNTVVKELKIISALPRKVTTTESESTYISLEKPGYLRIACGSGSELQIMKLQPLGSRIMDAKDYWNGLQGRGITLCAT